MSLIPSGLSFVCFQVYQACHTFTCLFFFVRPSDVLSFLDLETCFDWLYSLHSSLGTRG